MIHWIRPDWFWALIPAAAIWVALGYYVKHKITNQWQRICDPHLLPYLVESKNQSGFDTVSWILLGCLWLSAIIALAGPSWTQQQRPTYHQIRGRMVLLDMSADMHATDLLPSRLARARYKLMDFLKQSHTGQVGLIAFNQWPYLVTPLTEDTRTILSLLPQLTPDIMPSGGYNINRALVKAKKTLVDSGATEGDIIIMTATTPSPAAQLTARQLANDGFQTLIWGIGTANGGPIPNQLGHFDSSSGHLRWAKLNTDALAHFAQQSQGRYVAFTNNNQDVNEVLALTQPQQQDRFKKKKIQLALWQDQGHLLCWLIALLCLFVLQRQRWGNTV